MAEEEEEGSQLLWQHQELPLNQRKTERWYREGYLSSLCYKEDHAVLYICMYIYLYPQS